MFKSLITKQVIGNRKGFTILELVVVLLILSILSGFLYSKFTGREQAAKIAATYSTILRHFEAAKSYTANHGTDGDYTNATQANLEADGLINAGLTNPWTNVFTIVTTTTTFQVSTVVDTAATATALRDRFTAQGYTSGGTGKTVSITF